MKAQQEILTPVLMMGILIAVIGSIYLWGIPLIQKNKDITTLEKTEDFMKNLNNKIKNVANTGGRDQIMIDVSGTLTFDPTANSISVETKTKGTIYSVGGRVPFVRNMSETGIWGKDEPEVLYAESRKIGENYLTVYNLTYRQLNALGASYKIILDGVTQSSGQNHNIIIENRGSSVDGLTKTMVGIRIE